MVGMPIGPVELDIVSLQAKEASIETCFVTRTSTRAPWPLWAPKKTI